MADPAEVIEEEVFEPVPEPRDPHLRIRFMRPFHDGERMWPIDKNECRTPEGSVLPRGYNKTLPSDAIVLNDPLGTYRKRPKYQKPVNPNIVSREMRLLQGLTEKLVASQEKMVEALAASAPSKK